MTRNTKRILLGVVAIAIYVLILLVFGLRADALGWPWSHSEKQQYVKAVYSDLKGYALILGNYQAHPPETSTAAQDEMYITRGEMDISIVEEKVRRYEKGDVAKSVVEDCLKQLDHDIEDVPAVVDHRRKS